MTKAELAEMLTQASMIDNRNAAPENVNGWYEVIGHLPAADATTAMWTHFRTSTAYLLPAHIVAGVFRLKEQRAVTRGDVFCPSHAYYPLPCDRCTEDAATPTTTDPISKEDY